MSHKISMEEFGEIITIGNNENKKLNKISKSDQIFKSNFEELILSSNLSVIKWEVETKEDLEIFGAYKDDSLCIRIAISGSINQYEEHSKSKMNLSKNEIACISIKEVQGREVYKKNTKYQALDIYLKNDFFDKHMPTLASKFHTQVTQTDYYNIIKQKKIYHQAALCANKIFNSSFENNLNELFIYGNILELLSYELQDLFSLEKNNIKRVIKFSQYDMAALEKAKEILFSNLENAPNLSTLSKLVKLNEFKLKYGFKKFFKITPYHLLLEYRMEKAYSLLEKSEYNINEISSNIGYKQASNFTKAFYKKYNILPKDLMKNRTYYY